MKTTFEHHTVTKCADGSIKVASIVAYHKKHPPMDNGNLRALLRKLVKWTPADNFGHVVTQIRKGRTYLIRNGAKDSVQFTD
jgi:hypothetical protein